MCIKFEDFFGECIKIFDRGIKIFVVGVYLGGCISLYSLKISKFF